MGGAATGIWRVLARPTSATRIVELICDRRRAAARLRYTGTHTGVLLGLPATQRRFDYAGAASASKTTGGSARQEQMSR